jgi:hypothetical protein
MLAKEENIVRNDRYARWLGIPQYFILRVRRSVPKSLRPPCARGSSIMSYLILWMRWCFLRKFSDTFWGLGLMLRESLLFYFY